MIMLVLLLRTMFTLRVFAEIYGLWASGGPANAAMVMGVYLYEVFQRTWDLGKAASTSWLLLIFTLGIAIVFIKFKGLKGVYE
jgi:ABC-type sugar transport system permease subunit